MPGSLQKRGKSLIGVIRVVEGERRLRRAVERDGAAMPQLYWLSAVSKRRRWVGKGSETVAE